MGKLMIYSRLVLGKTVYVVISTRIILYMEPYLLSSIFDPVEGYADHGMRLFCYDIVCDT